MKRYNFQSSKIKAAKTLVLEDGRIVPRIAKVETFTIPGINPNSAVSQDNDQASKCRLFYFASVILIAIAVWILYLMTLYISDNNDRITQSKTHQIFSAELERLANFIIEDQQWNVKHINLFLSKWESLDVPTRQAISASDWYQHFAFLIQDLFREQRESGTIGDGRSPSYKNALLKLEQILKPKDSFSNPVITQAEVKEIRGLPSSFQSSAALNFNNRITEVDIEQFIEHYTEAYQQGSIDNILQILSAQSILNGARDSEQRRDYYQSLFDDSESREVEFLRLNRENFPEKVVMYGDYSTQIHLKNDKGVKTIVAKLKMEMQKAQGQLEILSFELIDPLVKVTANTPKPVILGQTKKSEPKGGGPTAAEVQEVVTRFVEAYESGTVNSFDTVFAKDAKTNGQNDLQGIKFDYAELFTKTTGRQLFIQDINWNLGKKYAVGVGDLKAIVLSDKNANAHSEKGKIQIIAQKFNDKVLITHLYYSAH